MDEFWSRKMRRLALLAVVNSVAIPASASEPQAGGNAGPVALQQVPAEQPQDSLRSLLSRGWESKGRYSVTIQPRVDAVDMETESAPENQLPKATVLRPRRAPLSVTEPAVENTQLKPLDDNLKSTSLADLLRRAPDSSAQVPKQVISSSEAAKPTIEPEPASLADSGKDQPERLQQSVEASVKQLEGEPKSSRLADLLKTTPVFQAEASRPTINARPVSMAKKVSVKNQPELMEQSLEDLGLSERQTELLHDTVKLNGFGLLATDEIEPPVREQSVEPAPVKQPEKPNLAMIHATRLQEVAQGLLRDAFHSLRRNANYTAKKKATKALRSVIAMRDAANGGNRHSRELEAAMVAIRESREFGAGIEAVGHEQLKRLVAVHKTQALKEKPLAEVSSLGATVAYLEFAKEKLVSASGGHCEASYALQLLGQIEKRLRGPLDANAAAIALTFQRSAVEVDPSNAIAQYELGRTYSDQGLSEQALTALTKSIELSPSRDAYEQLLATARKMGDIDMVRTCKRALADSSLPSSLPLVQLEPALFAATHRPQLAMANRGQSQQVKTHHADNQNAQTMSPPKHSTQVTTSPQTKSLETSSDVTAKTRLSNWLSLNR